MAFDRDFHAPPKELKIDHNSAFGYAHKGPGVPHEGTAGDHKNFVLVEPRETTIVFDLNVKLAIGKLALKILHASRKSP